MSPAVKCDFLAREDTTAFPQCSSYGSSPNIPPSQVWVGRDRKKSDFPPKMIFSGGARDDLEKV